MSEARATITIKNHHGLHARPAMALVDLTSGFSADIKLVKDRQTVDAKSIMQLMMLAAVCGTTLEVIARGPDAAAAVQAIEALNKADFED
ncbi:MAG: HPr family phosphocarrier protein [Algisphaera sp.]